MFNTFTLLHLRGQIVLVIPLQLLRGKKEVKKRVASLLCRFRLLLQNIHKANEPYLIVEMKYYPDYYLTMMMMIKI